MAPRSTAWGAYKDIASALRGRIVGGEFPPGAALPSESALCTEYGVVRNTVRRALDELAAEGLVSVRPGVGRVVASPGSAPAAGPPYRVIVSDLRAKITAGELRPGDLLPSEATLAARYGVARGTVRRAVAELEGAGLVDVVHGKGRFVRQP